MKKKLNKYKMTFENLHKDQSNRPNSHFIKFKSQFLVTLDG